MKLTNESKGKFKCERPDRPYRIIEIIEVRGTWWTGFYSDGSSGSGSDGDADIWTPYLEPKKKVLYAQALIKSKHWELFSTSNLFSSKEEICKNYSQLAGYEIIEWPFGHRYEVEE